jgi:gamma-glutamylcyclotransferase (GGCT)/AIG2-like uncharacterized protein YtfP
MLYFAYGSNMHWPQMKDRCSSSRYVGNARLPDYRLDFTRRSITRGCGVADAVAERAKEVWGVVYEISEFDLGRLDKAEGFSPGRKQNSYWRRECMVFLDGDESKPLTTQSYFAESQPDAPPPNQEYKDLLLAGARHWRLPEGYVAALESVRVSG